MSPLEIVRGIMVMKYRMTELKASRFVEAMVGMLSKVSPLPQGLRAPPRSPSTSQIRAAVDVAARMRSSYSVRVDATLR